MSNPMPPGFPPPNQQPLPPASKKPNILLWILGGILVAMLGVSAMCGLGGYLIYRKAKNSGFDTALMTKNPAYATAKMAATMAPNVETVSSDDDKGTITVRDKDSGKTTTLKFDPQKKTMVVVDENGKEATMRVSGEGDKTALEMKTADGTVKFGSNSGGELPSWVPSYPGSSPAGTFSSETKEGKQAGFGFKISETPSKVISFYQEHLKASGFAINMTTTGEQGGLVMAEDKANNHVITVTVTPDSGGSAVNIMAIAKN